MFELHNVQIYVLDLHVIEYQGLHFEYIYAAIGDSGAGTLPCRIHNIFVSTELDALHIFNKLMHPLTILMYLVYLTLVLEG